MGWAIEGLRGAIEGLRGAIEGLRGAISRPRSRRVTPGRPGGTAAAPFALAALAGVLVYAVAHGVFPYHSVNHDEGVYLQQAGMLLEGQLFLTPPVEDAFRPWFFVEAGDRLYPKYTPVPAAMFALARLAGDARLALAAVAATNVGLTYGVVRETFDRRTGLLAGAFLLASPLFLVNSAVFLSYAPTTALNLLFAVAYLRADRTGSRRWAALAGAAVGTAFFSRPYTAVLFAAPFVGHALWTLRRELDTETLLRHGITAALGLGGVAVALAYNAVVTGSPLLFPYQAFAPLDGLGFGRRSILTHDVVYTPALALRSNARVLAALFSRWVVAGLLGTALAAVGLVAFISPFGRNVNFEGASDSATVARRATLVGIVGTVVVGNLYFWGNFNILGNPADPTDGLIHFLGPYYHFDLLVPTAAFGAHGVVVLVGRVRGAVGARFDGDRSQTVAIAGLVVGATVLGGASVGVAAGPIADNRAVSDQLAAAYAPFEGRTLGGDTSPNGLEGNTTPNGLEGNTSPNGLEGNTSPNGSLVFLPTPYGPWLNHPFQALRNDPGFDGETVYALRENQFAVVDAYPDRRFYRYTYRGRWAPFLERSVEPRLQRVRAVSGARITVSSTLGVPEGAEYVSIRLSTGEGNAYYVASGPPESLDLRVVADGRVRLRGPRIEPAGNASREPAGNASREPAENTSHEPAENTSSESRANASVAIGTRDTVVVQAFVSRGTSGFDYRMAMPVRRDSGAVRALTPYIEVCRNARRCGGEAAYVPAATREGVFIRARLGARG